MNGRPTSFVSLVSVALVLLAPPVAAAPKLQTISVMLEVVQKYPGVASPGEVITGCREGFPVDSDFTAESRWEVLGSKRELIGTAGVSKISVKNIGRVLPPFHEDSEPELQPYIYNGTCVYTANIKVPKSQAYRFLFGGVDLRTSYSLSEIIKRKWKVTIKKDLNCGGLYGKDCK